MFISNTRHLKDLKEVDVYYDDHIAWIEKQYADKKFIATGRNAEKTGGLCFCSCATYEEAKALFDSDPFVQHGVSAYTLTEFTPTRCLKEFAALLDGYEGKIV